MFVSLLFTFHRFHNLPTEKIKSFEDRTRFQIGIFLSIRLLCIN